MNDVAFDLHNAWEHELRDAKGLWLSSGHLVSFKFTDPEGKVKVAHGHFESQGKPGFAKIKVKNGEGIKDGVYEVDHRYVEAMKAELPPSTQDSLSTKTAKLPQLAITRKEVKQGDIVQTADASKLFGQVTKVTHNKENKKTNLHVKFSDGKEYEIEDEDTKPLKVWRGEPVEANPKPKADSQWLADAKTNYDTNRKVINGDSNQPTKFKPGENLTTEFDGTFSKFTPDDPKQPNGKGKVEKTETSGHKLINFNGRVTTVADINGVKVPFYLSSGAGGKKDVEAGKWYPFFGMAESDDWYNKGSAHYINNYYGSPELKAQAEWMDKNIGDVRNDKSIPVVGASQQEAFRQKINQDMHPVNNLKDGEDGAENVDYLMKANVADVVKKIRQPAEENKELKDSMTGAEVQAKKMETVKSNLEKEGRFPIPRQTTSDHWGVDSDITKGAKQDYKKVYNKLVSDDPKWKKEYPTYDSFFEGAVKGWAVDQQTQSPNDLKDIPQEMKDINKAYATEVLGLKPDGKITFYRNAVNGHTNMEDSARGYVTTHANFAHDYNAHKGNQGSNGRYEIDAKPDEVYGMLGYSKLEDEYGVTVGHGVTKQPGRIRRVGDLKSPALTAPWLKKYDDNSNRSGGGTPFRHHALAGLYDFHPVDEEMSDIDKMFEKWHLTSADIKNKFDEKYGKGAYDDYKASGQTVGNSDLKKFFMPLGNGKVGFDPTRFDKYDDRSLAISGYGDHSKPESFKNDKYDNVLKIMSTLQDLTGQKIMTPKGEETKEPAKQTGIFNEYNPAQRMSEETSNAAENTRLSELGFDPEKEITVFRGVPTGVKGINPGDWVTANKMLAKDYAGNGDVISMKVKHKHLLTDPSAGEGGYTEEMVYRPVEDKKPK